MIIFVFVVLCRVFSLGRWGMKECIFYCNFFVGVIVLMCRKCCGILKEDLISFWGMLRKFFRVI